MPDRRKHRGKHPEDDRLFAESRHEALRTAVAEYSWLLTHGYAQDSALKLVGDRHNLTVRQRVAVMRSACSDQSLRRRMGNMTALGRCEGGSIGIDGYNLLITIESSLSGGLILIGRDGCYRDLASVHGTYRKVEETQPALELIIDCLASFDIARIDWYLDQPVSNSGRLKAFMAEILEARGSRLVPDRESPPLLDRESLLGPSDSAEKGFSAQQRFSAQRRFSARQRPRTATWNIELVNNPDAVLSDYPGIIASSDSVILDQCGSWLNLAREIIIAHVQRAWIIDLRPPEDTPIAGE